MPRSSASRTRRSLKAALCTTRPRLPVLVSGRRFGSLSTPGLALRPRAGARATGLALCAAIEAAMQMAGDR